MNEILEIAAVPPTNKQTLSYVLITPARNEEAYIAQTLKSVTSQTVLPLRWVIVSDGSTDRTDAIVSKYATEHSWIELLRMPERTERNFAGKVYAFNAGLDRVKHLDYDIIGNLDADVSFEPDYLEYLLEKFESMPKLGVAGTNRWEGTVMYDYRVSNIDDVAGACQLFRRECFEAIGGYKPVKNGGIDLVAMLSARMHGWQTRSFTDRILIHHRPSGTATASRLMVHFNDGRKDYLFGGHPLWEIFRACYRMTKRPMVLSGLFLFAGYASAMLSRLDRTVSDELMRFRRREQMSRLRRFLMKPFTRRNSNVGSNPVTLAMKTDSAEISIKGKIVKVPSVSLAGRTIIVTGKWIKVATVMDEEFVEGDAVDNLGAFVQALRQADVQPDIFTFSEKPGQSGPRFSEYSEADNAAVIPLKDYSGWWDKLPQETRRNVRKSTKLGVIVKEIEFNDELVRGISEIYNETPVRQGRQFWHYGKPLEEVKRENASYRDRSAFLGAYYKDELIGFIKMVFTENTAAIMQILSKNAHYDKRPANALIAKAVEVSLAKGKSSLTYCKYVYGKNSDSALTEFKRRNGFEQALYPRYFVPLTSRGKLVIKLKLHHGWRSMVPEGVLTVLLGLRKKIFEMRKKQATASTGSV